MSVRLRRCGASVRNTFHVVVRVLLLVLVGAGLRLLVLVVRLAAHCRAGLRRLVHALLVEVQVARTRRARLDVVDVLDARLADRARVAEIASCRRRAHAHPPRARRQVGAEVRIGGREVVRVSGERRAVRTRSAGTRPRRCGSKPCSSARVRALSASSSRNWLSVSGGASREPKRRRSPERLEGAASEGCEESRRSQRREEIVASVVEERGHDASCGNGFAAQRAPIGLLPVDSNPKFAGNTLDERS